MHYFNLLKKARKSDLKATHRSWARGGGVCLAYGLKPACIKSAEHSSTQHRPKFTEINQWLLLINRYVEKHFDVSVDKSKQENEAKSK